jgi:hypothetical protein
MMVGLIASPAWSCGIRGVDSLIAASGWYHRLAVSLLESYLLWVMFYPALGTVVVSLKGFQQRDLDMDFRQGIQRHCP